MSIRSVASIKYNSDSFFNGILHYSYFTSESFSLNSELKITASSYDAVSTGSSIYSIIGAENPNYTKYFSTTNEEHSWIQFELKDIKISISKFVYRAKDHDFFDKWQLLGSNNNRTFDILYEGVTETYNTTNKIIDKHYDCDTLNCSNQYSYIRVITNGQRNEHTYTYKYKLAIYGFEIYGNVYNIFHFSLSNKKNIFFQILFYILII